MDILRIGRVPAGPPKLCLVPLREEPIWEGPWPRNGARTSDRTEFVRIIPPGQVVEFRQGNRILAHEPEFSELSRVLTRAEAPSLANLLGVI